MAIYSCDAKVSRRGYLRNGTWDFVTLIAFVVVCQSAFATGLYAPVEAISGEGSAPAAGNAPTPNLPRNAQVMDQSAYAMGSMTWNVIFVQNNGSVAGAETWSPSEISSLQTEITQAKSYWEGLTSGFHPGAQLSININYVNGASPMTTSLDPTASQSEGWVNHVMAPLGYTSTDRFTNVRNFNQAQRVAANTHWSTTIFALDNTDNYKSSYAYAYFGGPFTILTRDPAGWQPQNFNMVLAHEMGHIFNALDEYQASGVRNTQRGGYLNGLTLNAELDGAGNPVVPPQPNALMLNNGNFVTGIPYAPHPSASVNFGHRDTDNDTIPDILDTFPTLTGNDSSSNAATGNFVFSGSISVNDYNNSNPLNVGFSNSQSDMTINTIASMSYTLDGGLPVPFPAVDGTYDDYTELLSFTIPSLSAGNHTIDVIGTNSVGNSSNLLQFSFTSTVPEPSTLLLAVVGLASLLRCQRRHLS
ncbi:MAG: PEP-CTERM sorting domain-containing protein [Planctomycetales bacterium]|nr:PEP-CTERM sorting domain-containing protein [Planctomycetales bacterium]